MMEMLYKYFGDIIGTWEHGKPYENMRKEKKRVDDDWQCTTMQAQVDNKNYLVHYGFSEKGY